MTQAGKTFYTQHTIARMVVTYEPINVLVEDGAR